MVVTVWLYRRGGTGPPGEAMPLTPDQQTMALAVSALCHGGALPVAYLCFKVWHP